jgi:hypothetical protein
MFLHCRGGALCRDHDALCYKPGEEPPLVVCLVDRVLLPGFQVVGVRSALDLGLLAMAPPSQLGRHRVWLG